MLSLSTALLRLWRVPAPILAGRIIRMSPAISGFTRCQHTALADLNHSKKSMPRIVDLRNGEKAKCTFSKEEMNRRVTMLRTHMEETGLVASLFTSYHNVNYFSDFFYCSFGRQYALIVTMDTVTTVSAKIDGGQPWRRCQGDNVVYTDWHRGNFYFAVGKVLEDCVGKIGVEYDNLPLDGFGKFQTTLRNCQLVDVGEAAMRMRMKKSPEEISLIKEGARIADLGGWATVDAIGEGVGEHDVAMAATQAMTQEIARTFPHAELRDTWSWFMSGLNTDGAHNPVTTRRIRKGDILSLNCFPVLAGYYTALERTMFFDHIPSDRHLELWEINCSVHRRGMQLIKPGIRCKEIAAELNEIYARHDLLQYRSFGYGYSFGVLGHYYGREAALELRDDIETKLEPGMVVSMVPMIMIPEGLPGAGGYREHDILVVTEDGNENITKFPFGPEHLIVKK